MKTSSMMRFLLLSFLLALAGCQTLGPGDGKSGVVIFESDEVITADFKSDELKIWYEGDKIHVESSTVYTIYPNVEADQLEEIEKDLQFIQVNREFLKSLGRAE
jgi:hypothetical protein